MTCQDYVFTGTAVCNVNSDFHVSGNSEDETDDREMFDTKLASIARGQVNPDWDILFGDGEPGAEENIFINNGGFSNTKMVIQCNCYLSHIL